MGAWCGGLLLRRCVCSSFLFLPLICVCFLFNLIDSSKNQINDKGQRTNTTNDKDKEEEHRTLYQHPEQRIISETNNSFKKPHAAKNNNKNVEDT